MPTLPYQDQASKYLISDYLLTLIAGVYTNLLDIQLISGIQNLVSVNSKMSVCKASETK